MKSKIMRAIGLTPKRPKTDEKPAASPKEQAYEHWLQQQIRRRDNGGVMEARGNKMV